MKLIIDGKLYAISPHKERKHYDLMKWQEFGKKKKARTGKNGTFKFDGCFNDFEALAKHVLNREISDETAKDMQQLLTAWKEAVQRIVSNLESNVS